MLVLAMLTNQFGRPRKEMPKVPALSAAEGVLWPRTLGQAYVRRLVLYYGCQVRNHY